MAMRPKATDRIRSLIDELVEALRAKDADRVLAAYAPELVNFDLAPPLAQFGNGPEDKKRLEAWFATWAGPLGYEVRDFKITAEADAAFAFGFTRIHGTKIGGERADVWARQTLCFKRIAGDWKVVHEHTSVPFYMDGSYRAATDLSP